jgi:hypothetical protein
MPLRRAPVPEELRAALLLRSEATLMHCNGRLLSQTVYGLAALRLQPPASWLDAFTSACQRHRHELQPLVRTSSAQPQHAQHPGPSPE